jgi:hypothetical protein
MILDLFTERYFSFLLSGRVEDFQMVSDTFQAAVQAGVTLEQLQTGMNESHASAEALCLILDSEPVDRQG